VAFATRQFQEITGQGKSQHVMPSIGELSVDPHDAVRQTIDLACGVAFRDDPLAGAKANRRRQLLQFSQFTGIEGWFAEQIREVSLRHCTSIFLALQFLAPAMQIIRKSAATQCTPAAVTECSRSQHSFHNRQNTCPQRHATSVS
jgi:hypothetical protein